MLFAAVINATLIATLVCNSFHHSNVIGKRTIFGHHRCTITNLHIATCMKSVMKKLNPAHNTKLHTNTGQNVQMHDDALSSCPCLQDAARSRPLTLQVCIVRNPQDMNVIIFENYSIFLYFCSCYFREKGQISNCSACYKYAYFAQAVRALQTCLGTNCNQ